MSVMSLRVPDDLANQLDALAAATGRTKSFLAGQAIRDFVERGSWQIAEITQAVAEADKGEFASDEEVAITAEKWQRHAG
jgi:RHH-type rel operon transcriptional repressor/antitoxin RelB